MILDAFFIMFDLVFDLLDRLGQAGHHIRPGFLCNKFLFMLGFSQNFDRVLVSFREVDNDINFQKSIKEVEELFGFLADLVLVFFIEMAVAGRNCHLHGTTP